MPAKKQVNKNFFEGKLDKVPAVKKAGKRGPN